MGDRERKTFFVPKKGEISILVQEEILYDFEPLLECEKTVFFERCISCNIVAAEEVL